MIFRMSCRIRPTRGKHFPKLTQHREGGDSEEIDNSTLRVSEVSQN